MKANQAHAVIAAGLESPGLIALWQQEPERLHRCGVDPESFDFDRLQKFAGLTAKVRHNGLRTDLPLTFRLLNVAGLEIELFAAYAMFRATSGNGYADTIAGREQDLLNFMEGWLDPGRHSHLLLWDVVRYEFALTNLGKMNLGSRASRMTTSRKTSRAGSVPRVCGAIILHEMRCDPRTVGAILQEKTPQLDDVALGTYHFCYWRKDAGSEVHILQMDELGYYLLSLADGNTTTAELGRLISGGSRPAKGILTALDQLGDLGIISFAAVRKRGT